MLVGNTIGGKPMMPKTCVFKNENGQEFYASLVDAKFILTAGINDIREGKIAITDAGVTTGAKVIPAYHTMEGYIVVPVGGVVSIPNLNSKVDCYDYTKLQALVCVFNTTESNSVATERVIINDKVYLVQSTDSIAAVTKNHETKTIELGISNNTNNIWILRYFMYKEI